MIRSLYTAASGMISQQRKHDSVTNNIANVNTPGFKQNSSVNRAFPEVLLSMVGKEFGQPFVKEIGRLHTGVFAEEHMSLHIQGDLQETQNPFDFALTANLQVDGVFFDPSGKGNDAEGKRVFQPQAFFTVENGNGELRYTRNGRFTVNDAGQIITAEGFQVLNTNGQPMTLINPNNNNTTVKISVTPSGQVMDSSSGLPLVGDNGAPLSLLISRIERPNELIAEGSGLYRLENTDGNAVRPVDASEDVKIVQGYYERSNVDPAQSMVDLMMASKAYEANQKVIQAFDRILEKSVNDIGRV
jgi:flagellar basal-body rod protein FlgG